MDEDTLLKQYVEDLEYALQLAGIKTPVQKWLEGDQNELRWRSSNTGVAFYYGRLVGMAERLDQTVLDLVGSIE